MEIKPSITGISCTGELCETRISQSQDGTLHNLDHGCEKLSRLEVHELEQIRDMITYYLQNICYK